MTTLSPITITLATTSVTPEGMAFGPTALHELAEQLNRDSYTIHPRDTPNSTWGLTIGGTAEVVDKKRLEVTVQLIPGMDSAHLHFRPIVDRAQLKTVGEYRVIVEARLRHVEVVAKNPRPGSRFA